MSEYQKTLNDLVDNVQSVVKTKNSAIPPIKTRILGMLASANSELPAYRKVLESEVLEVAKRSFSKNIMMPTREQIEFKVFREISNYIEMASTGESKDLALEHADLLFVGHPLSKSPEIAEMPEEELRQARADWIADDPRIDESYRPLVASAYASEKGSVERKFFVSRLSSESLDSIPLDIILGLED
jgi:hypothetical protein